MRRILPVLLVLPTAWLLAGCEPDGNLDVFSFSKPAEGQLSLAGPVATNIVFPTGVSRASLQVTLDGEDVTDHFTKSTAHLPVPAGEHELIATLQVGSQLLTATRHFETILVTEAGACDGLTEQACFDLNARIGAECEIFNRVECALPYPSSQFLTPASTPTGVRIDVPQSAMPVVFGPIQPPTSLLDGLDGFSPTVQIAMHFPQGVDVAASGLSRLLPPCLGLAGEDPECIAAAGPPWDGVRTHDARSLDPDHPTVLMHWNGERILHWTENDVAPQESGRQAFILRPGESLIPGERYIVAVRKLVSPDGPAVTAEPAFAALRDERPTDIPQLAERRQSMKRVFKRLAENGVARDDLILAFEFTVQSDQTLTQQMLAMRDQGLQWLADQTDPNFVVDEVIDEGDCSDPEVDVWKVVRGRYTVPLFLEFPPTVSTVGEHTVDSDDVPVQNGVWEDAPYHVSLPCQLHPDLGDPDADVHTLLLGHGIFGTGESMVRGIPPAAAQVMDFWRDPPAPYAPRDTRDWNYVAGATDWSGWSSSDFVWVGGAIIGLFSSSLHQFPAFPDRHRQGQLNTLILSRMLNEGHFNAHPEFQDALGNGLLPVPKDDPDSGHYYYGISMGGVQGLFHAAISTDIEKFGIDVGSMNFSFLLPRSTQFNTVNPNDIDFRSLLENVGIRDDLDVLIGVGFLHELWVSADPAGYMTHTVGDDLLPGNTFPKKLYLSPAWLDYQVSNHGTEITVRTLGLTSGPGSVQKGLVGIPDEPPGTSLDSALVNWDTGLHDILDPTTLDQYPPLAPDVVQDPNGDPHGARPFIGATIQTLMEFLQPGGRIENFCDDDGICDASQDWECSAGVSDTGVVSVGCP
ncbi:MAG: hypothetical protein HKP30_13015 [Myxococcales bacterium]|nr:hypothetical protein [Myxococcales bacterium]